MVGALQAWPWAACSLHRLQSLSQAAHLPGTPPWSPGPRHGLAATLGMWGPTACPAVSSEGWGAARGPWHGRLPSLGEEGPRPYSVLHFHDRLSGWAMATWSSVSAQVQGCLAPQVCLPALGEQGRWGGLSLSDRTVSPPLTVPPGATLLDLEQTTLPGIAHLVVETMIVSDQIRPEDRASVLRTLLLKHRCRGRGCPGGGLLGPLSLQEQTVLWGRGPLLEHPGDGELVPDPSLGSTTR